MWPSKPKMLFGPLQKKKSLSIPALDRSYSISTGKDILMSDQLDNIEETED